MATARVAALPDALCRSVSRPTLENAAPATGVGVAAEGGGVLVVLCACAEENPARMLMSMSVEILGLSFKNPSLSRIIPLYVIATSDTGTD